MKNILAENMRRFNTKNLNENLNDYVSINTNKLIQDLGVVYDEIQQDLARAGKQNVSGVPLLTRKDEFVRGIADATSNSSWPTWLNSQFKTVNVKAPVAGIGQTQTISAAEKDVATLAKEYTDQLGGGKLTNDAKMSIASVLVPNTMKK